MNNRQAVWITGIGTVNPLGTDYQTTTKNLLAGKSGVGKITDFDLPDHFSLIAGRIPPVPIPSEIPQEQFARFSPLEQLLLWSTSQAFQSAGLDYQNINENIGIVMGLGAETQSNWDYANSSGENRVAQPDKDFESGLEILQRIFHLQGPATSVAAACASGNYAMGLARRWIRQGLVDICLAGAGDRFVTPMAMASFGNLRALSRRNDDPAGASRPFDLNRDGFVMGEGGVVFVLESAAHARKRRAQPLAEIAGFGASSDAFHMVIPSNDPLPAVKAMREALQDAEIQPDKVDYINAHATSTPAGDIAESKVINMVLGDYAPKIPVSSTKGMTGHLLSGAAAMNALACLAALDQQALPPTINLDEIDPQCNLRHVPNQAQEHLVEVTVSNSLGFGGSNTSIVFRKAA